MLHKFILLILVITLTNACALWKKDKPEFDIENKTAEQLYGAAKQSMLNGKWADAIIDLQRLEARYPYGEFAIQAQLDTAYAHYKRGDNGLAVAAAARFLSINPTHPSVDYAYYIKGLASFDEESSFVGVLTGRQVLVDRDQKSIVNALAAFNVIIAQYPNSDYAFDANKRAAYLESALAEYEISVAKFYYDRGAYVATVNRCKAALEAYADRPQAEDALGLMLLSYRRMDMADLAADTQRILVANYPDSGYLSTNVSTDASTKRPNPISQAFKSLFN